MDIEIYNFKLKRSFFRKTVFLIQWKLDLKYQTGKASPIFIHFVTSQPYFEQNLATS